jgi:sulfate transport system permease protein
MSLGVTLVLLTLVVLLPLAALVLNAAEIGPRRFFAVVTTDRALAAFWLTISTSLAAATVNLVGGVLVAWVLVRYRFPGRSIVDALIDLPFAVPTAVSGIALTTLYGPHGTIGAPLAAIGLKVAYSPLGIVVALVLVGLPFVIRTVQPVLEDLAADEEEAAASLGAGRFTTFVRVTAPQLAPAAITGFALAFARGLGEYGSVVFIAGNMPLETEIAPLLIMTKLEQFDFGGATAIAAVLLALSFAMLLVINRLQAFARARTGGQA